MSRSLPPAQTQRIATTMSATGYQRGPKAGPLFHVSTAPIVLTTMPKTPRVSACGMGRRGAKRRRDVTASNAVDRAISHRQQEQGSRHRLAQGRVNPARMHHRIAALSRATTVSTPRAQRHTSTNARPPVRFIHLSSPAETAIAKAPAASCSVDSRCKWWRCGSPANNGEPRR